MLLPEFCKADAQQSINDLRLLLSSAPEHIYRDDIWRITHLQAFLEAALDAAPLIPKRPGPTHHGNPYN